MFAGTNLEGTEVNGLAAEVLPFLSILRPRSTFYDTAATNLTAALADRPTLQRTGDEVVMVLAEDFEDVDGMARQVGLAAEHEAGGFVHHHREMPAVGGEQHGDPAGGADVGRRAPELEQWKLAELLLKVAAQLPGSELARQPDEP